MDLGLKNKVAMVAGASRGLGFSVSKILAAEGANVSMASSSSDAINKAGEEIRKQTGGNVLAIHADVRSAAAINTWYQATIEKFGGVDLLFSNSGGPPAGDFSSFDDKVWQEAFELLLLSAVRMVRTVIPSMRSRGGGSIVLSTSSSVKEPIPNLTLSNVVRASVPALSKSLANELAKDHIRVNNVIPGRIDTVRVRNLEKINAEKQGVPVSDYRNKMFTTIPLGRYGDADEFARGVVFLLSDAASYITGATLQIDGGLIHSVM